jgi:hypothetical protein
LNFLTDAQTNIRVVEMLRALGWHMETVYEHGLGNEPADERLVAWARDHGFVFLTFDYFRGMTRPRVMAELRERGGKVLQVLGGPEQPPERAVGRLLFHFPDWSPSLDSQDGLAVISDIRHNCKFFPAAELRVEARAEPERQFEEYLRRRTEAETRPLKPRARRRAAKEQADLPLEDQQ